MTTNTPEGPEANVINLTPKASPARIELENELYDLDVPAITMDEIIFILATEAKVNPIALFENRAGAPLFHLLMQKFLDHALENSTQIKEIKRALEIHIELGQINDGI